MSKFSNLIEVSLLASHDWERLKEIRVRALSESPDAFGIEVKEVTSWSSKQWLKLFEKEDYLIASISNQDVGMLSIEVLNGDHGATCWVGGCWTDPDFRGNGIMSAIFDFIDSNQLEKKWSRQGLGVWTDNLLAINAYEKLGFSFAGEKMLRGQQGRFFQHMVRNSQL